MPRKKILLFCLVDPSRNPRPRRALEILRGMDVEVHVAAQEMKDKMGVAREHTIRERSLSLPARIWRKVEGVLQSYAPTERMAEYFRARRWGYGGLEHEIRAAGVDYDLFIVEDFHLLPLAIRLRGRAKILFDAREYFPAEFEGNILWALGERPDRVRVCRNYMRRADKVITVSPGLARRYRDEFGITTDLIRSMPAFENLLPGAMVPDRVRMVHHGNANRDRRLENMIDMFETLDSRFTLDFYLTGDPAYQADLAKRGAKYPGISFCAPIPFADIAKTLNQYDIGLYLLEPTGFNTEFALPNKFFEFIQARLALAIGPSPDMADLLRQYDCGVVSADFTPHQMAAALNALNPDQIAAFKTASDKAAHVLCFAEEGKKLHALISGMLPT